ncbi:MAG: hypothetical protein ACP5QM_07585, partial [Caldisericum sp.]|uniref:hypothetical protein n=1 Tax=Caldisericum sp. TaxID=2499687 RepID=UPI003D12D360
QEKKYELHSLRRQKVAELLDSTDLVILKICDLKILLELGYISQKFYDAEIKKCLGYLQRRRNIRKWNEYIETRIDQATSLEELIGIKEYIDEYQGEYFGPC